VPDTYDLLIDEGMQDAFHVWGQECGFAQAIDY